jgi:hypothetical protein
MRFSGERYPFSVSVKNRLSFIFARRKYAGLAIYGGLTAMLPVQGQLIDYVVENAEPVVTSRLQEHYDLKTDAEGLAGAWLPPGAELSVLCQPSPQEQDMLSTIEDPQRHVAVSHSSQFVGFELQQMSCVRVRLHEFGTSLPISGARIRFMMTQNEAGDLVDVVLKVLETSEEGYTEWVHCRTGALVRAELEFLPWKVCCYFLGSSRCNSNTLQSWTPFRYSPHSSCIALG